MRPSHVLVTGANGFIGRYLCARLSEAGFHVRGAIRGRDDRTSGTSTEYRATGPIEAVSDWAPLLQDIDAVVHTAATSDFHGAPTSAALDQMNRINVEATARLAAAAAGAGVGRFIYLSSIKVNGLTTTDRPFRATDVPQPVEPYGRSKLAAERALRRISVETPLELIILRPGLVYGPNPRGSVLQLMSIIDREIPLPFAWVDNRRSLVAVQNLCDLIRVCLIHPKAAGETFLVSDGADISTPDLIRRMARYMGRHARLFPMPASLLRLMAVLLRKEAQIQALTMSQQLDAHRTREQLGWEPPMQIDAALQTAVEDYLGRTARRRRD